MARDDGSCVFAEPFTDCDGVCDEGYNNFGNGCELIVPGCNDITAFNYNPESNINNGSCYYTPGCTDIDAFNYNSDADFDDGSCVGVIDGCTDSTAFNYNSLAKTQMMVLALKLRQVVPIHLNYDSTQLPTMVVNSHLYGCIDDSACIMTRQPTHLTEAVPTLKNIMIVMMFV